MDWESPLYTRPLTEQDSLRWEEKRDGDGSGVSICTLVLGPPISDEENLEAEKSSGRESRHRVTQLQITCGKPSLISKRSEWS